ncbi:MAG: DNA-processing protein DprA [Anaerolineales bacterium]|nr:DNA-processing protein DprA [Anaerolineales bacterium]
MNAEDRLYTIALNLIPGVGAVRFAALVDYFGSPLAAWEASPTALRDLNFPKKVYDAFLQVRAELDLVSFFADTEQKGIAILTATDEAYPHRLKSIDNPPPVIYMLGKVVPQDEWAVAIVGTRKFTHYGREVAEEMAAFLARNGVTVVSGLARGVDSIAHRAALDAGGRTIAVLGSGVDIIYPPENRTIADEIISQGAVISDYPPGTPPDGINFPPRNRIISGLSLAAVVVEAGERSGASITANYALEQGREVFAVPGNIYSPQSKGTNRLIRDGAHPLLSPEDLLDALNLTMVTEQQTARMVLPGNALEAAIFEVLGQEPVHVDQIGIQAGLPIEQISSTLALMELKGMVRQVGGMRYIAVREAKAAYYVDTEKDE